MSQLRTIEKNIIEALGSETLTLEQIAPKAGYEVNGHFKKPSHHSLSWEFWVTRGPAISCSRSICSL